MIVSPLRIYVSSSWKGDLEEERKGVEELIKSDLLMIPVYPQEAAIRDVSSNYFKKVNECDLVIVILGALYSEHVDNEINYAFSNGIPVLCFIKEGEKQEQKLTEIISKLKNQRIIPKLFGTTEDLRQEVKEAVINLLSEKFKDCVQIEKAIVRLINDGRIEILKPKPLRSEYIDVTRVNPFERR
jgi:nucleoside 2-deoxyribosyltransferase